MRVLKDRWMAEHVLFFYLLKQATKKLDERKELVGQIRTREDVEKRQAYVRRVHRQMSGGFPERTPPNPRMVGKLGRADYVVEKIIFESQPQFYVPANLYLPKGHDLPVPGILHACGHSANGKAALWWPTSSP